MAPRTKSRVHCAAQTVSRFSSAAFAPYSTSIGATTSQTWKSLNRRVPSIEALSMKAQLRWAGHVSRMEDHRLPKIALYGELSSGHRDRGAPKKRYKDTLKKSLSACHIDHRQWSALAADRDAWRRTIHQSVSSFENNRRATLVEKRSRRKNRVATAPTPDTTFP